MTVKAGNVVGTGGTPPQVQYACEGYLCGGGVCSRDPTILGPFQTTTCATSRMHCIAEDPMHCSRHQSNHSMAWDLINLEFLSDLVSVPLHSNSDSDLGSVLSTSNFYTTCHYRYLEILPYFEGFSYHNFTNKLVP